MQRLRSRGTSFLGSMAVPHLKRKALNSWAAVQDTYFSTKDTFERHKVVFTVGTSIASVATAWFGYSLQHYHESKVDQRLESIEKACPWTREYSRTTYIVMFSFYGFFSCFKFLDWMKNNHLEHADFKKLVEPGPSRTAAWIAMAGTALVVGYGLGWRGWQLQFLRPSARSRGPESAWKTSETSLKNAPASCESVEACQSC